MALVSILCMISVVNVCPDLPVVPVNMICANATIACAATLVLAISVSMDMLNATVIRSTRVYSARRVSNATIMSLEKGKTTSIRSILFQVFIHVFLIHVAMVGPVLLEEIKSPVYVEASLQEINARNVSMCKSDVKQCIVLIFLLQYTPQQWERKIINCSPLRSDLIIAVGNCKS